MGCAFCAVGAEMSTQEAAEVNAKVREIFSRKRTYIASALRDAVANGTIEPCDPEQKAIALTGMIDGVVAEARIMNDTGDRSGSLRFPPWVLALLSISKKRPLFFCLFQP